MTQTGPINCFPHPLFPSFCPGCFSTSWAQHTLESKWLKSSTDWTSSKDLVPLWAWKNVPSRSWGPCWIIFQLFCEYWPIWHLRLLSCSISLAVYPSSIAFQSLMFMVNSCQGRSIVPNDSSEPVYQGLSSLIWLQIIQILPQGGIFLFLHFHRTQIDSTRPDVTQPHKQVVKGSFISSLKVSIQKVQKQSVL